MSFWYGQEGGHLISHGLAKKLVASIDYEPENGNKTQNAACGIGGVMLHLWLKRRRPCLRRGRVVWITQKRLLFRINEESKFCHLGSVCTGLFLLILLRRNWCTWSIVQEWSYFIKLWHQQLEASQNIPFKCGVEKLWGLLVMKILAANINSIGDKGALGTLSGGWNVKNYFMATATSLQKRNTIGTNIKCHTRSCDVFQKPTQKWQSLTKLHVQLLMHRMGGYYNWMAYGLKTRSRQGIAFSKQICMSWNDCCWKLVDLSSFQEEQCTSRQPLEWNTIW